MNALVAKAQRRINKMYGLDRTLVRSFLPRGRSQFVIYVVELREHPGVVKVGRTTKWHQRRLSYARWNLRADGDAIAREMTFVLADEYVDLPALEMGIIQASPFPLHHGAEWFRADFDEYCQFVDRFICETGLTVA